ncbi:KilA-N domain-containing protein [Myxococcus sp. CA040A]|uniref:KilA-N domain-containing protein n=1 Tax=Myxococcus sp. CA040A TaxID=2741738 RepID=UPI00157A3499|nr:phage antirepressor KilAC domain-containing protein [Myxococcus sp. CA040A]NTX08974.1 phage antirepressor KilAC domain-containing protein [Myxococcus sp. CA040A]
MTCLRSPLKVGDVVVQQDAHGRYSLNDLHRAAGLEKRHQPSDFLRTASVAALVDEIHSGDSRSAPVEVVNGGPNRGTYACRLVALRYAAWISAPFEYKVYKVLEDYIDGRLVPATPALPANYIESLEALLVSEKEKLRLSAENAQQAQQLEAQQPHVDLAQTYLSAKGDRCLRDAATALRIPPKQFNAYLVDKGICYRRPQQPGQKRKNRLLPYAEFVERGYLVNRARLVERQTPEGIVQDDRGQTMVTPQGMAWLHARFERSAAPQVPLLPESTTPGPRGPA